MSKDLILVLDAGTTSTRAMLFGFDGSLHSAKQAELEQFYPKPGWVEHDAAEIWAATLSCAQSIVADAGHGNIAAIGITNQRETVVAWSRTTGQPLTKAIVWQDRRTAPFCEQLRNAGHEAAVQSKTGLRLDPYFSGTKMRWMLDNDAAVRAAADSGDLAFGTVESWLVFKLTGGKKHITDASNASRTLLLSLDEADWSKPLCDILGVPRAALPEIVDNCGDFGSTDSELFGAPIVITGLAGDQQSATIGQGCLSVGDCKATFGTGAFVLANKGTQIPHSKHRLLGTVLYQLDGRRHYALEGSVFVAGSLVKWLRDSLGIIGSAAETEKLARSVTNSGEVVIVPALSGLGAPHWRSEARGVIAGLSFNSGKAQIARAALEAMAHQTHDLASAFDADGAAWTSLKIDGGMSANDWMAQDIADIMNLPVERPDFVETTALGAAMLAGVGAGIYSSLEEASVRMRGAVKAFKPVMPEPERRDRLSRWAKALAAA
ncbi:glycerol kinase GlpK [Altererythrobacter aquiaggeris]|uniref:glycerol kinase GlpK n=1 Tax=Aestuarierythrobacter aquiaggeris TaxID=1898396 RepID=UPI00301A1624